MILLDTHVLIWLGSQPDRLSRVASSAIRRARSSDGLAISDVTLWELALLFARGSLRSAGTVEDSVQGLVDGTGVNVLPVTTQIAAIAAQFPAGYPKDPVDRLIGGTARAAGMTLVTRDERIRESPLLRTVW